MALSCNQYTLKVQRLDKILAHKAAPKAPEQPRYGNFARSPKPAFSKKGQKGDQGKSFKNRPKSSARLKGPKALLRKWHYSLIFMHLNCKDWKRFLSKQAAPKVLECPSYGNFGKVTQNSHFLKKERRGDQGKIFQKSPTNQPSLERLKSTLAQIAFYFNKCALLVQILEKILTQKTAPKAPEWPSYGNFCKVTLNPHFVKKCKWGTKGNFSKIP